MNLVTFSSIAEKYLRNLGYEPVQCATEDKSKLQKFTQTIADLKQKGEWSRGDLIDLFNWMIPNFDHKETGKFLDGRM